VNLVFFLEEPSARDLLTGLLPKLLPESVHVHYLVFDGKQDLEGQLVRKLRGWRMPDSAFVVLRDQDAAECRVVRTRLAKLVEESKRTPSLVRVACRELESWIVGDWHAVAEAFDRPNLAGLSVKDPYREPDALVHPVETLRKHIPEYQKRDGARRVGGLLDPQRNQSRSFRAFCAGLLTLVGSAS
jgi:uncharacterized protein DUF4276